MKILAISKREFEDIMIKKGLDDDNIETKTDVCSISITDPDEGDDVYEHHFKCDHQNVLNLKFGDVSKDITTEYGLCNAMSKEQAKTLYEFIKKNRHIERWVVHCTMGISRSAAVSMFINDFLHGDKEQFKRDNPHISPNPHVYRLLYNEYENDEINDPIS
jgi:predicted protein tyrosine phosphatase